MVRIRIVQKTTIFLFHFFLPALMLIGVVAYVVFSHEANQSIRTAQDIEAEIIVLNEQTLSGELQAVFSDLVILANDAHLKSYINGHFDQIASLEEDFILFSQARKMYDQIRYIDHGGMERVRVNAGPDVSYAVPESELQNKKNRYYFTDTFELGLGRVFVSPLDLNIEHGKIEIPLKPMIRFGTPVFNDAGEKKGAVILNYYGKRILDNLTSLGRNSSGQTMLVNSDGYFLKGQTPADEWGFMYPDRKNIRFDLAHKAGWEEILNESTGQFIRNGNLYTFATVYPIPENARSSSGSGQAFAPSASHMKGDDYFWKIVSVVPAEAFRGNQFSILMNLMIIVIPVVLIVGVGSWFLTSFKLRRILAEKALIKANENLEATVAHRTDALIQLNKDLNDKVRELNDARDVLIESERYYRALIDHIKEDIMVIDPTYKVTDVNETFLQRVGLERHQAIGRYCYEVSHEKAKPCDVDPKACPHRKVLNTGETKRSVHQYGKGIGGEFWVENVFSPLRNGRGQVTHVIKVSRDISEERKLENQLRQAQKMEAIGRLAGGIAHDFNNILFPILGYTEMALEDVGGKDMAMKEFLEEIFSGVIRAKNLVSQILAFSYQTEQELKSLKINIVVKEALKLLKSSIPSTIEIQSVIDSDCMPVLCDATQVHQIVMNLCTNAYHAMEGQPGKIEVSLTNVELFDNDVAGTDQLPGRYVRLDVQDTGKSIDLEFMDRIFEPYFTTKEKGKGTGLGLSVVHGIVKSYGGHITVFSEKGKGTRFSVFFPALQKNEEAGKVVMNEKETTPRTTGEHLMLVDDDPTILNLEKKALSKLGYQISTYVNSVDAYKAFKARPEAYDMVITDFTMPNLTGEALARKINHMKKETPIILLTGFSAMINPDNARKIGIKAYVSKPVILSQLTRIIRLVLDGDDDVDFFKS